MSNKKCEPLGGSFKHVKKGYDEIHILVPKQMPTDEAGLWYWSLAILSNRTVLGILQAEENDDYTNGNTGIQHGRENIVIFRPPREVTTTDDKVKDESDDGPGNIVSSSSRWDKTSTIEDNGPARRVDYLVWIGVKSEW